MMTRIGRRSVLRLVAGVVAFVVSVGPTAGTQTGSGLEITVDARNLHAFWESQRADERGGA